MVPSFWIEWTPHQEIFRAYQSAYHCVPNYPNAVISKTCNQE
jgi:hypothetical protein